MYSAAYNKNTNAKIALRQDLMNFYFSASSKNIDKFLQILFTL